MRKKRSHCVLGERCITAVFKYSACNFEHHQVRMNRPIYIRGGNSFLSNFYVCSIHDWGHRFTRVEAAYIHRKCVFYAYTETADKMLATRTGLQAKYLSKTIREKAHLRTQWNQERRAIIYYLVAIKFRNAGQRKWLLDTQHSHFKECVRSKEGFWSMLTYTGQPGQNVFGQILMERREFIRKNQTPRETCPDASRTNNGQTHYAP